MSNVARSVLVFSVYLLIVGPMLAVAPNVLLSTLGFPAAEEPWIRVLGVVAAILGYYYLGAARENLLPFFRAGVRGRLAFLLGCIGLAALRVAPPNLILFGLIDGAGALWTALCLKKM